MEPVEGDTVTLVSVGVVGGAEWDPPQATKAAINRLASKSKTKDVVSRPKDRFPS